MKIAHNHYDPRSKWKLLSEVAMRDTSVTKVQSRHSPRGELGQKYLASGVQLSMRLWDDEQPGAAKPASTRALTKPSAT
jgi:hypothetical protein